MNGKFLAKLWNVESKHSLYRETGDWYHQLKQFPGALFDKKGYVLFNNEADYRKSEHLQIKKDVHIVNGIASMPEYIKFSGIGEQKTLTVASPPLKEGDARSVIVNKYERNTHARKLCLEHYGTACVICGVNLENIYGKIARGIIHVHHLLPMSSIGKQYIVNPITDLRPVCPNCHGVIHKKDPPYTIEEVKIMINNTP